MEEWLLYFVLAGITTLLLLGIKFLRRTGNEKNGEVQQRNAPARENVRAGAPNRRVAAVRNRRAQGRRPGRFREFLNLHMGRILHMDRNY